MNKVGILSTWLWGHPLSPLPSDRTYLLQGKYLKTFLKCQSVNIIFKVPAPPPSTDVWRRKWVLWPSQSLRWGKSQVFLFIFFRNFTCISRNGKEKRKRAEGKISSRCQEVKDGCEICRGEPVEELEAELEEAQLQIRQLEKILGRAVGREEVEEEVEGKIEGHLENGWREAMRAVRRRSRRGGDGVWHRKYQEIETVL